MPGVYALGDYDIAGFIVGVAEKTALIDESQVAVGDALVGLPSSGLHTNGFSLVRYLFKDEKLDAVVPELGRSLADELLVPHRSYLEALRLARGAATVLGAAHITGGGLVENVPRALPAGLAGEIRRSSVEGAPIFQLIESRGVLADEMWRTFNMGIGMVLVVRPADVAELLRALGRQRRGRDRPGRRAAGAGAGAPGLTRLGVLVSGRGTNLEAILTACADGSIAGEVAAVISNKKCHAIHTAVMAHVPLVGSSSPLTVRRDLGPATRMGRWPTLSSSAGVDLVVCAGYDRILHEDFVARFAGRILNVHPSLLPAFGGSMTAIQEAFEARAAETGVTIHYIEPSTVDAGTIIAQEIVPIRPEDTVEALEARVHEVEHRLYPAAIQGWIDGRVPRPAGAAR